MDSTQHKQFAFYPECYGAPIELLATLVPAGKVTEKIWKEALSDHLITLAHQEADPSASTKWACKALGCWGSTDDPNQIAQYLYEGNAELKTLINLSVDDLDPNEYFPQEVSKDNEEALEAINHLTLFDWVYEAAYFIGGDALDSFLRHERKYPMIRLIDPTES